MTWKRDVAAIVVGSALLMSACALGSDQGPAGSSDRPGQEIAPSGVGGGDSSDRVLVPPTPGTAPRPEPVLPPLPADAAGSGVWGLVVVGPQCAAVQEGERCPPVVSAARVVARIASGPVGPKSAPVEDAEAVGEARAAADGLFLLPLPAGDYVLEVTAELAIACDPVPVSVPVEGWAELTIVCDSGIR